MKHLYILLIVITFTGCSSVNKKKKYSAGQKISKEDFKEWYAAESKSSLHNEQKIGRLTYSLTFVPAEVMSMNDVGATASSKNIIEMKKDYDSLIYFVFKIQGDKQTAELLKYDLESSSQYQDRVNYCSFEIQDDIKLEIDQDKYIACAACLFERAYGIAPYLKFVVAFEKKALNNALGSDLAIVFDDHLFSNGPIKFAINNEVINQTPTLKL